MPFDTDDSVSPGVPPTATQQQPDQSALPPSPGVATPMTQATAAMAGPTPPAAPTMTPQDQQHAAAGAAVTTLSKPNTPGSLARSILAGALVGLANMGGAQSPGEAAGRAFQGASNFADKRRQQQFENQQQIAAAQRAQDANVRAGNQDAREADRLKMEQESHAQQMKLNGVNSDLLNLQVLHQNQLIQGTSLDQHRTVADSGKAQFDAIMKSGGQVLASNVSETEMHQQEQQHPSVGTGTRWFATGWEPFTTPNGKTDYQMTYSRATLPSEIEVTPALVDRYKKADMDNVHPGWQQVLKPGAKLTREQMDGWDSDLLKAENLQITQAKSGLDKGHVEAEIRELNARARQANAAADKETRSQAAQNSLEAWDKVRDANPTLAPDQQFALLKEKDKTNVRNEYQKQISEANRNASTATANLEKVAKDLSSSAAPGDVSWKSDERYQLALREAQTAATDAHRFDVLKGRIVSSDAPAQQSTGVNAANVTKAVGLVSSYPADQAERFINASTAINAEEKKAAIAALRKKPAASGEMSEDKRIGLGVAVP